MGIVLGALGGTGDAMQKIGATNQKALLDEEADVRKSDLALQREQTMAAFRNDMELKNIPLKAKANAAATLENAPTVASANSIVAGAVARDKVTNAPLEAQAKIAGEYSPELVDAKLGAEEKSARQKARVEREELIATGNDPAALRATRNLAQARHIEGLGSVAQAELAKLGIEEKQKVAALISEFESTADPARKAKIKESLTVRGIIKPGEYDTEEVTTEKMDDEGNVTKTKRVQKRRADGATPQAEPEAVARPTSMAEFAKLPKGARFVNPKDGKTYTKN